MSRAVPGALIFFLALVMSGCGATVEKIDEERRLPFTVKVHRIEPAGAASSDSRSGESDDGEAREPGSSAPAPGSVIPASFDDPEAMTSEFVRSLREAAIFTRVVTGEELGVLPDLEMQVEITGRDFGAGTPQVGGAIFSTFIWLFGGHLSWFINNREYPQSDVRMTIRFRAHQREVADDENGPSADTGPLDLPDFTMVVNRLSLNFRERAGMGSWLANILLPPWYGDGDTSAAGRSLSRRSLGYLVSNESDRFLNRFPLDYFSTMDCYLVHDGDNDELILLSGQPVNRMEIRDRNGPIETLNMFELMNDFRVDEERERRLTEELDIWLDERAVGLSQRAQHYFIIPIGNSALEEIHGHLWVEVTLEDLRTGRWTIYRPPPEEDE